MEEASLSRTEANRLVHLGYCDTAGPAAASAGHQFDDALIAHLVSPLLGAAVLTKCSFAMMGAISAATVLFATGFVVSAGRNLHATAA